MCPFQSRGYTVPQGGHGRCLAPEGEVIQHMNPTEGRLASHDAQPQSQACPVLVILEGWLDSFTVSGEECV